MSQMFRSTPSKFKGSNSQFSSPLSITTRLPGIDSPFNDLPSKPICTVRCIFAMPLSHPVKEPAINQHVSVLCDGQAPQVLATLRLASLPFSAWPQRSRPPGCVSAHGTDRARNPGLLLYPSERMMSISPTTSRRCNVSKWWGPYGSQQASAHRSQSPYSIC